MLEQRKRFAALLAADDRARADGTYRPRHKSESWTPPEPQRFYGYWLERFSLEEITELAEAFAELTLPTR